MVSRHKNSHGHTDSGVFLSMLLFASTIAPLSFYPVSTLHLHLIRAWHHYSFRLTAVSSLFIIFMFFRCKPHFFKSISFCPSAFRRIRTESEILLFIMPQRSFGSMRWIDSHFFLSVCLMFVHGFYKVYSMTVLSLRAIYYYNIILFLIFKLDPFD